MINPNKTLTERALAGAHLLRMHAKVMADDDDFFIALMSEPHAVAADAIEQLVKENEKLRAQLVAFQKAVSPAVMVDPAKDDAEHTCYTTFVKGTRVCLRANPLQLGTVVDTCIDECRVHWLFVRFQSPFEADRWVKAKHLELIPQ
ncbi:hypothetical protein AAGQ49_000393 [Salmonella enterica]